MNIRVKNLDALRLLASFMVVLIHVSAPFVTQNMDKPNVYFTIGNIFDSIARTAVPIFVMLSGTFILDNPMNKNYSTFYKKIFRKIIIPTLVWSLVYCIYNLGKLFIKSCIGNEVVIIDYIEPFINWANGKPFYHMWYMYMVVGLYLITPFIIKLKENKINRGRFSTICFFEALLGYFSVKMG